MDWHLNWNNLAVDLRIYRLESISWMQWADSADTAMCIQSLFKNGLIVGIFGAVFTVAIAILGWVAMPNIIANVSKKVFIQYTYLYKYLILKTKRSFTFQFVNVVNYFLWQTLVLEENNFVWNLWYDPPYPIYTDFYIFNCTNYNDVVRNGTKPIVVELGPYSYRWHNYW